jgi:UDP-N-acetylmuramoyl-L-alanyl-D-glutamate--2,6-diaminopimelate ligase
VFGCGGDRDKSKRHIMGGIAEAASDLVFVTNDNPRTEAPKAILKEIVSGMQNPKAKTVQVIEDRAKAIGAAVKMMKKGDVLVVAGKGHEDYQIVGETKHHFDDREEILKAVEEA